MHTDLLRIQQPSNILVLPEFGTIQDSGRCCHARFVYSLVSKFCRILCATAQKGIVARNLINDPTLSSLFLCWKRPKITSPPKTKKKSGGESIGTKRTHKIKDRKFQTMPSIRINNRRRYDPSMELRLSEGSEGLPDTEEFIDSSCASSDKSAPTAAQRQQNKTVRFFPDVTINEVERWESVDHPNIWFSSSEMTDIRKECRFTIQCLSVENMNVLLTDDDSKYCGRGLESMTPSGRKKKASAKLSSKQAVIDEQWSQWYGGIFDEEAIAEKYATITIASERVARIWGLKDQWEAKRIN